MAHFSAAIEDLLKSFGNLFAGVFGTISNIVTGFFSMIVHFFTSFADLITGTFKGAVEMIGGLGRFIAGNLVLFGILAAGLVAYQRFVVQGGQPKPITQAKKTT